MKTPNNTMSGALGALTICMFSGAALAATQLAVGDAVGKDATAITAALETSGYTEIEVEAEDSALEVEAMLDGASIEFEVSPETGKVMSIDASDEPDDEDKG